MKLRTLLPAVFGGLALTICGCAHMHIVCQDAGITNIMVGGSTVGQQIVTTGLAVAGAAASGAKFAAAASLSPKPATPTAQSQSFVDYTYVPIFNPDFASCNTLPPPGPPSTSIIFVAPDGSTSVVTSDSHQIVVAPPQKRGM